LKRDFALRADPADQCDAGLGIAKIHIVRIGPLLGLLMLADGRRDELDQLLGVHARWRQRRQPRDVRNGNDRRHADAKRHDADKREGTRLRQGMHGVREVAEKSGEHSRQ
jgi:hypothetical protein